MYRPPPWLRLFLLSLIVVGIAVAAAVETASKTHVISAFIDRFGPFVPVVFVLVHILASLVFVPRSVMAIVATLLFGFWEACWWSTLGSIAGAMAGFLIARYINSGFLVPEEMKRVGPILERAEDGGWRAVAVIRLLPLLPHALVNYALGLTRLSLAEYTLGSLAGMLPETYVFVNLAVSGRRALDGGAWMAPMAWGLALVGLSVVVPKLLRRWVR
jgi:uncharacterized membrane protein YdjX (TVP38/TMEM64 family)